MPMKIKLSIELDGNESIELLRTLQGAMGMFAAALERRGAEERTLAPPPAEIAPPVAEEAREAMAQSAVPAATTEATPAETEPAPVPAKRPRGRPRKVPAEPGPVLLSAPEPATPEPELDPEPDPAERRRRRREAQLERSRAEAVARIKGAALGESAQAVAPTGAPPAPAKKAKPAKAKPAPAPVEPQPTPEPEPEATFPMFEFIEAFFLGMAAKGHPGVSEERLAALAEEQIAHGRKVSEEGPGVLPESSRAYIENYLSLRWLSDVAAMAADDCSGEEAELLRAIGGAGQQTVRRLAEHGELSRKVLQDLAALASRANVFKVASRSGAELRAWVKTKAGPANLKLRYMRGNDPASAARARQAMNALWDELSIPEERPVPAVNEERRAKKAMKTLNKVEQLAALLSGRELLLVSNDGAREHLIPRAAEAGIRVRWVEWKSAASVRSEVHNPEVAAIVAMVRWLPHAATDALTPMCQAADMPLVRAPGGFGLIPLASAVLKQASRKIADRVAPPPPVAPAKRARGDLSKARVAGALSRPKVAAD